MIRRRWIIGPAVGLGLIGIGVAGVLALGPDPFGGRFFSTLAPASEPDAGPSWDAILSATKAGQWPRVEALLRDWIDHRDDDGKARVMLAQLLVSSNRDGEAARTLADVPDSDPAYPDARVFLGEMALAGSDAPRAELAFRQAAAADPKAIPPRGKLIYLLSLQLRTAEARAILWEIFRATGEPGVLIDLVLEATKAEVDVRGIGPEIEQFLRRSPDDPFLQRAHGLALLWKGQPSEALPLLEAAASSLADDPLGRFSLAECRAQLGLPVTIPEDLGPIPDPPADASRWWLFLGRLTEADDPSAAAEHFRHAAELNPQSSEAHFRLSQVLAATGEDSADEHARRADELRQRWGDLRRTFTTLRSDGFAPDPALYARLGDQCRDASLIDEARSWYEQANALVPDSLARDSLAALADRADPFPVARSHPRRSATTSAPESLANASETTDTPEGLPTIRFDDVAASAGITFQYDHGSRDEMFLADTMGGGVGLIDFDHDGRLDLYFVNGCPMPYERASPPRPNVLYRNLGDGTFEDVTESAGVGGLGYGMGCAVGDFDHDGLDDLYVTGLDRTILYRNLGDGTFEDVTESAGVGSDRWTTAAGFADLDGDGDLDLFVATYVEDDSSAPRPCRDHAGKPIHCSPGQYPAQQDLLFRNDGDGTFTDISAEAGIEAPAGRGLGLAIADLDGDGLLDLYVANDASPDFVFRNLGGLRFEELGASSGLALDGSGHATASMGVVADDLDGDGLIDLFHTNFLNETNTLHRNLGDGQFADVTMTAGLAAPSLSVTGFGAVTLDADNDGQLDLFVSNGHVDDQPWVNSPMAQPPQFSLGRGDGRFALAPPDTFPYLGRRVVGRGVAAGDLDNDGRVDLVVVHRDAPASVLMNRTEGGHWLGIQLVGTDSGRSPVGARVTIEAGGRRQTRWITSGTSYLSSSDSRLWFGLGPENLVDRLEIRWPSGLEQLVTGLAINGRYLVREGESPERL